MLPGIYKAKIHESYGLGESKVKGTLFVVVNVKIQDAENKVHVMQWCGWLSEKAIENTNKALAVMGMETPNYELLAEGKGLDMEKVFFVTVEDEIGQDGKTYSKIKWINATEGGGKIAMLDKTTALTKLKGLGLVSGSSQALPF